MPSTYCPDVEDIIPCEHVKHAKQAGRGSRGSEVEARRWSFENGVFGVSRGSEADGLDRLATVEAEKRTTLLGICCVGHLGLFVSARSRLASRVKTNPKYVLYALLFTYLVS